MRAAVMTSFVVILGVVLSGCQILVDPETGEMSTKINWPKSSLSPDAPCVVTSCHGLSVACGAQGPEACTMEYQLGDFCRQYANCGIVDGQCQLQQPRLLQECISCVELCDSGLAGSDPTKAFTCEQQCREQMEVMERAL